MTPEEIEARILSMSYEWEQDVRGLIAEVMAGAPPPQPPPPPPAPPAPPASDPWNEPRRLYEPINGRRVWLCQNRADLLDTLPQAQPGDVVRLVGVDYGRIEWRKKLGHQSGRADAPIVLQAAPGQEPKFRGASVSDGGFALMIEGIDHHVTSGLTVEHSQFPMRVWGCRNWRSEHAIVQDAGHAGFHIARATDGTQASDFTVSDAIVRRTGRSTDMYGEGFYLGNGSRSWVDCPTRGKILRSEISETRGDAVDLKSGVSHIELGWLKIHDCDVPSGSAISHTNAYADQDDPTVEAEKPIWGHDIDIWNIGWGGLGSIYGVTCDRGGELFERVRMWGFRPDLGDGKPTANTRGFNVRGVARASKFPITLRDSVVWVDRSIVHYLTGPAGAQSAPLRIERVRTPDGLLGSTKVTRQAGWPGVNVKSLGDVSAVFG